MPLQSDSEMIINLDVNSVPEPENKRGKSFENSHFIEFMGMFGFFPLSFSCDNNALVVDIFVGLNEEESSQRIAEALVHEYYENFLGNSHGIAVVSELLVSPEWGVVHVPARIMSQLCMYFILLLATI